MNIKVPTLIIDQTTVNGNIERMARKAEISNAIFRPHFKTHHLAEVGKLFKHLGISKITVSSVSMAEYFAKHGWNNITIAFPVNLLEIDDINILASKVQLNILVESLHSALKMSNKCTQTIGVFIKIDAGYNRTGLTPNDTEIGKIIQLLGSGNQLVFKGFLSHAGNTYSAKSRIEITSIMDENKIILNKLKQEYIKQYPDIVISYGDTPSCSLSDNFSGFDEIRPGNFAYYDVMQYHIGSCTLDEIAVAIACPIVAIHTERNELVIYGGAVHLSKEFIEADNAQRLYGYVVNLSDSGWSNPIPGAFVSSISQEHGIIKMLDKDLKKYKPGDIVGVLPIHSCLAANLLRSNYKLINN
jgi:D-serine deaminase-like pyridoxal phosphate-dependent protein